jgi:hypothetical protein
MSIDCHCHYPTAPHFDDTKRCIDQLPLSAVDKFKVFEGNAKRVFSRLAHQLEASNSEKVIDRQEVNSR